MPAKRRSGFFAQDIRPEDEAARLEEVAALLAPRRSVARDLPVQRITPNPFQARTTFTGIDELAAAIRTQGFVSRLRVRPDPARQDFFQLVYGERRLRAARLADLTEIPCEIADHTDEDLIEIGLAENIQRHDLDPLEEAHAFQTLITQRDYSIRRLAERIGKDKSYIEDRLTLLRVPEDVQQMIAQRPDALRSAREIAKLDTPTARQPLIEGVVAGQLSTGRVREIVRSVGGRSGTSRLGPEPGVAPTPLVRESLDHDVQTLHTILARWHVLLAQGATEHALVAERTEDLLLEVQRLVEALAR